MKTPEHTTRIIVCATQTVTLGQYVKAWRAVRSAPPKAQYGYSLCGWAPSDRETILQEFDYGLHDRINRHIPGFGKGRKWDSDWQRETSNAVRAINNPRLRIYWLPMWLKKRFPDRISNREDD